MPSFDDEKADKKAQNIIKSVFPKRKILALNGIDISLGGGNIHCITQQQPLSINK
jgi:agmatine deiminase